METVGLSNSDRDGMDERERPCMWGKVTASVAAGESKGNGDSRDEQEPL